jgi:hypothetical protein
MELYEIVINCFKIPVHPCAFLDSCRGHSLQITAISLCNKRVIVSAVAVVVTTVQRDVRQSLPSSNKVEETGVVYLLS